ncbi:MAG: hypothetical protein AB1555_14670 [Nitrospirota bacterium]
MARLEVFVHKGCLSEQRARGLARAIHEALPAWEICVRHVSDTEADAAAVIALPAFVVDGQVVATGIPQKDWLVAKLREWERNGSR